MRKLILLATILIAAALAAETVEGDTLGPSVSKIGDRELKWEDGAHDFFVMFKSLLSRQFDTASSQTNMQPDTCRDAATFTLQDFNIPPDAYITDAFLIWNGAVPLESLDAPTDNTVTLSFTGSGGGSLEREITAGEAQLLGGDKGFPFEGTRLLREIVNEDHTGYVESELAYFTYRVDITDFFAELHAKGRELGLADGASITGDYTVSGLDCTNQTFPYLQNTSLVSNWAIVFVYTSNAPGMNPKKIYLYNGLKLYNHEQTPVVVSGFQLPDSPVIRLTLMVSEGDSDLYVADAEHMLPEGLDFRGAPELPWAPVFNICHPHREPMAFGQKGYDDIFNSISSFYNWDAEQVYCIGGLPNAPGETDAATAEWAIDVDTFILRPTDFPGHFTPGDTDLEFNIRANQDMVVTNLVIVSVDTKPASFDIPDTEEKSYCSCADAERSFCDGRPLYYLIRVENWGEAMASQVTVRDAIPNEVTYIAGTTEIGYDPTGSGEPQWHTVPDDAGVSPVVAGLLVADTLAPCLGGSCSERYFVRFKVQPKDDLPKNIVINNTAEIFDTGTAAYFTNSNVPVRLRKSITCPPADVCASPDRCDPACGGCIGATEEPVTDDTATPDDEQTADTIAPVTDKGAEEVTDDEMIEEESNACGCSVIG
ncbi:MAG TPA: hypothetical protein PLV42_10115 [bacterium]|nr:hypothetical protein [bacterium]